MAFQVIFRPRARSDIASAVRWLARTSPLRRDIDPDREVDVQVLDVNDDEARTLLLTIDPLAELEPPLPPELAAAWQAAAEACLEPPQWKRLGGEGVRSRGTCW